MSGWKDPETVTPYLCMSIPFNDDLARANVCAGMAIGALESAIRTLPEGFDDLAARIADVADRIERTMGELNREVEAQA